MSDSPIKADDRTQYGGQAVVEGVMMRSPRFFAIACRRLSNNEVFVKLEPVSSALPAWLKWLNKPFLRGTAALIDAMAMGIRALTFSANFQLEDEESNAKIASEVKAAGAVNLAMGEGVVNGKPSAAKNKGNSDKPDLVGQSINGIAIGATTLIALLLGFALFWTFPAATTDAILGKSSSKIVSNLLEGGIRIVIFFLYLLAISRMKNVQRVFEYHGAEHKAINTLEAGCPLTLENARKSSRIHPRCGTNFIFIVLITAILVFSVLPRHTIHDGLGVMLSSHLYRLLLMPVVAGISYEILKFAGSHRNQKWAMALIAPGLWTQQITTREPADDQIEVALKSLIAVWDREHEAEASNAPEEPAAGVA